MTEGQRALASIGCPPQKLSTIDSRIVRDVLDALPAAIYTTDAEGRLTHFNDAAAEMSGRRPELGTDRWCVSWKLYHPDGTPLRHDQCPMAVTLKEGRDVRGEEIIVERPDGTRRWVTPYPTVLRDAGGNVIGAINMLVDITGHQQATEALRLSDRRKGEFLVTLAHELRGPLAPICSSLEILQRVRSGGRTASAADPEQAAPPQLTALVESALDVLDRQIGQVVRLVDDLLDVGRIGRGALDVRIRPVELQAIVHHAVEAARPLMNRKGHQLVVDLPPDAICVDADSARITQIIGNLLDNACKFTDPNGRIRLSVERSESEAVIRISDTGIGIAASELPHVFEMFTQLDNPVPRSGSGLGIGLALVKNLAELHGGSAEARSAGLGEGSEFVVRLPATGSNPLASPPPQREAQSVPAMHILVVDDNRDAAESLALLLEFNGHRAHMAHDGLAAVDAALEFQPDAIFLDLSLPVIDGYEAARRIRKLEGVRRPLLVAVTGWGQEEHRRRSREAGFDAHVIKPVDDQALLKLLRELRVAASSAAPGSAGA